MSHNPNEQLQVPRGHIHTLAIDNNEANRVRQIVLEAINWERNPTEANEKLLAGAVRYYLNQATKPPPPPEPPKRKHRKKT